MISTKKYKQKKPSQEKKTKTKTQNLSETSTFWKQILHLLRQCQRQKSNTELLLPPSAINLSSTQGVLRLPWVLLLHRPFSGGCPELPRHVASRDSLPAWQRAQPESRSEAAEATPHPLLQLFPWKAPPDQGPTTTTHSTSVQPRGSLTSQPASSKPTGDWQGFPAGGRIGGASGRWAPPPGGLPSAASYSLQAPRFLAEESEALRPAAVPHRMPSRRRRSSSSHSKPKSRPGSRIRAARAEWGLGRRGRAGRSAAAWEARATEGTKTAITLAAAESPPREGGGPGSVWTPSQSAWPLGRLSPPSPVRVTASRRRRRAVPALRRAQAGASPPTPPHPRPLPGPNRPFPRPPRLLRRLSLTSLPPAPAWGAAFLSVFLFCWTLTWLRNLYTLQLPASGPKSLRCLRSKAQFSNFVPKPCEPQVKRDQVWRGHFSGRCVLRFCVYYTLSGKQSGNWLWLFWSISDFFSLVSSLRFNFHTVSIVGKFINSTLLALLCLK